MRHVYLSARHFSKCFIACLLVCFVATAAMPVLAFEQPEELLIGIEPEHNILDQMEHYRY